MVDAVTVFRNIDAGAPQLTGRKPSDIVAILRACLVDGYGSKQPLGWTVEFDNAIDVGVVFRNNVAAGGSGGYCKFSASADTAGAMLDIRSAQSMTDIDTLIKAGYRSRIGSHNVNWTEWWVVGTPKAFYLIIGDSVDTRMGARRAVLESQLFCGDIHSFIPQDQAPFIANCNYYAGDAQMNSASYSNCFMYWWRNRTNKAPLNGLKMYGADGTSNAVDHGFMTPSGHFSEYASSAPSVRQGVYCDTLIGVHSVSPDSSAVDPDGVPYVSSRKYPAYRGKLPGILNEVFTSIQDGTYPMVIDVEGQQHLVFRQPALTLNVWLNLEEW
ncbi:hypothetical protein [Shewanella sp. MBTL60-007]|uniref:hypothetical protein n=1 Tax=Shewanella sp. MBTL60-007 TaxID=2815911 RepID=UPI001BC08176|nr:hypothetical protein [Shewanella sp. MBTL60-007]GIU22259.1 hypothetical protein TUM3792_24170 [Shewanella sp. MBTL60-007]